MWIYNGEELVSPPENAVGFVYLIQRTNLLEDQTSPYLYIGKKLFYGQGRKNKGIESDWNEYFGSCKYLTEDIEKYGAKNFIREILKICYSKSELAWEEVNEQIKNNVLEYNKYSIMPKKYYNGNIFGKFYKNKLFVKEDITRIKDYISDTLPNSYRVYITNGEVTKCVNTIIEDIEEILIENPGWYLGSTIHAHNADKVWVNNGKNCKLIKEDELPDFLDSNPEFVRGFFCDKLSNLRNVTDGNITIRVKDKILSQFLEENPDFHIGFHFKGEMCIINDGINIKKMYKADAIDFIQNNTGWKLGAIKKEESILLHNYSSYSSIRVPLSVVEEYIKLGWEIPKHSSISSLYKWIHKDGIDKKVNPSLIEKYIDSGWKTGRHSSFNFNKIAITKNNSDIKYIDSSEIEKYKSEGWIVSGLKRKTLKESNKVFVCNNKLKKQKIINKDSLAEFLKVNPGWEIGQFKRTNFNTTDQVFAIDIVTGERVKVSKKEYKENENLVSVKTRKVKIKSKGVHIFEGYLKIFCRENNYPIKPFNDAIRKRKKGAVKKISRGKNIYLNDFKFVVEIL